MIPQTSLFSSLSSIWPRPFASPPGLPAFLGAGFAASLARDGRVAAAPALAERFDSLASLLLIEPVVLYALWPFVSCPFVLAAAIPSMNKALVMELARCEYIQRRDNVIAIATSPGVSVLPLDGLVAGPFQVPDNTILSRVLLAPDQRDFGRGRGLTVPVKPAD